MKRVMERNLMLPETLSWKEIKELYDEAAFCLFNSRKDDIWSRQETKGLYLLWTVYYHAKRLPKEGRDHLTYARILVLMNRENRNKSNAEQYREYLKPAIEAYDAARLEGKKVNSKEYEWVKDSMELSHYDLMHSIYTEENGIATCKNMENGEKLLETEFNHCHGKIVYFSYTETEVEIHMYYTGYLAKFRCLDLWRVSVDSDPVAEWEMEIFCYPLYGGGGYKFEGTTFSVVAERIIVESVEPAKYVYKNV